MMVNGHEREREREKEDDVNFLVWVVNGKPAISANGILKEKLVCVSWGGVKMSSSWDILSLKWVWDIQVVMSRRPVTMGGKYWNDISTIDVDLGIINI